MIPYRLIALAVVILGLAGGAYVKGRADGRAIEAGASAKAMAAETAKYTALLVADANALTAANAKAAQDQHALDTVTIALQNSMADHAQAQNDLSQLEMKLETQAIADKASLCVISPASRLRLEQLLTAR